MTNGLKLDLVGKEFPEHLSRLGDLATKHRLNVLDLDQELGLDPPGIDVGGTEHSGQPVALDIQRVFTSLLCVEAPGDFVLRERAIRERIEEAFDADLNTG